jgi:hypothetical protein
MRYFGKISKFLSHPLAMQERYKVLADKSDIKNTI